MSERKQAGDLEVLYGYGPCPNPDCKEGTLRKVSIKGQPVSYTCEAKHVGAHNCGLRFDVVDFRTDFENKKTEVIGKAENPLFISNLDSGSFLENLDRSAKMDKEGIPFYLPEPYILDVINWEDK
jgi:hypothetical protein